MIKKHIVTRLSKQLNEVLPEGVALHLEKPKHHEHGDYALIIAFQLASVFRKSPKIIAEELSVSCSSHSELNEDFEFFPINGFINIKLKDCFLKKIILEKQLSYLPENSKKICLEFVSANPTGPLHIGHGRWAVMGSVLSNILTFVGHSVENEFYINDAGNQVDNFYASVTASKNGESIPENGYHGAYIHDLAKISKDPLIAQLKQQKETLSSLGVTFKQWFPESDLHKSGEVKQALSALSNGKWTYEKDGATWFRSSDLGDEKDRVLIKADGKLTYFAVDIAYHYNKLERKFDQLINIWGADHHGYVARVKASVKALKNDINVDESFTILIGQLVNLLRNGEPVRMSKRTGDMICLDEVIDEIGVDAIRYFLVSKSADTHIEFDLELAKKKSAENPVYYIQYAHARLCTLLSKLDLDSDKGAILFESFEAAERAVLIHLIQFHDEVESAAFQLSPYKLAQYTYDLAKLFHSFYEACPVLKANEEEKKKRLYIVRAVKECLVQCLTLLGISAPESM
jgi:arginyl-tRNA synthetase